MRSTAAFRKTIYAALVIASWPGFASAQAGGPTVQKPSIETLVVDRDADDEAPGSLRWAIIRANSRAGAYRISVVSPPSGKPRHIRLRQALPPIIGPLDIEGAAWSRDGRHAVIDGSSYIPRDLRSCPGLTAGQYGTNVRTIGNPGLSIVDTRGVVIRGIEVRGFCIGILVLRSSNVRIEDDRIVGNLGGAGVMFSGDDGKGGSTAATTINNKALRNVFVGNGDGLELTRGAAYTLVADNVFEAGADNLEPSQGIEALWGNDNVIVRNHFVDYSDGIQVNWGERNYIAANRFSGNAVAISVTGADNVIDGNEITRNGIGIAIRPESNTTGTRITGSQVYANGFPIYRCHAGGNCDPRQERGDIVIGLPGPEHAAYRGARGMGVIFDAGGAPRDCQSVRAFSGCQPMPQRGMRPPVIEAVRQTAGRVEVRGRASGPPSALVRIEFFGLARGGGGHKTYIGALEAVTDSGGEARFEGRLEHAPVTRLVATTTDPHGATSAFSTPFRRTAHPSGSPLVPAIQRHGDPR